MKFKKFKKEDRSSIENNVMFLYDDGVVRVGYFYEDYHGNGYSSYYFKVDGISYDASQCYWCPVGLVE